MADTDPTPSPAPPDSGQSWLREGTTTAIGLAIAAVVLVLLLWSFAEAPDFQSRKEVLLISTGLLSAVLGYYFGRMPAERRADQAASTATDATARAATAAADKAAGDERLREARTTVEQSLVRLTSAATGGLRVLGGTPGALPDPEAARAIADLQALVGRL